MNLRKKYRVVYTGGKFICYTLDELKGVYRFLYEQGKNPIAQRWDTELYPDENGEVWTDIIDFNGGFRDKRQIKTSGAAWKGFEREVAALFGANRTPLSGMADSLTKSDIMHPVIFAECKLRSSDRAFNKVYDIISGKNTTVSIGRILLMFNKDFDRLVRFPPFKSYRKFLIKYKVISVNAKSILTLYDKTEKLALAEGKIPMIALRVKNKQGFLIGFEFSNLKGIADEYRRT